MQVPLGDFCLLLGDSLILLGITMTSGDYIYQDQSTVFICSYFHSVFHYVLIYVYVMEVSYRDIFCYIYVLFSLLSIGSSVPGASFIKSLWVLGGDFMFLYRFLHCKRHCHWLHNLFSFFSGEMALTYRLHNILVDFVLTLTLNFQG